MWGRGGDQRVGRGFDPLTAYRVRMLLFCKAASDVIGDAVSMRFERPVSGVKLPFQWVEFYSGSGLYGPNRALPRIFKSHCC
jgi:hypothetical protein